MVIAALIVLVGGLPLMYWRHREDAESTETAGRLYEAGRMASTADVQSLDQLWRELANLQNGAARLGKDGFTEAAVGATAAYLELEPARAELFAATVSAALQDLDAARRVQRASESALAADPSTDQAIAARREAWGRWQEAQRAAADLILAALEPSPRHGMLAEDRMLWLLKLDAGRSAAER